MKQNNKPLVVFVPGDRQARVRPGTTLLVAARSARASVRTRCGGMASCLQCKVKVADQRGLEPPDGKERSKLGGLLQENYRLACQARVRADVTAEVPEDPLRAVIRRKLLEQDGD